MTNTMTQPTATVLDEVEEYLKKSVHDVFDTMLSVSAQAAPPPNLRESNEVIVVGTIGFVGNANGVVHLHVNSRMARTLACRLLGMSETELSDDAMVNDAIGELSNMIVGSVKSRLCDSGSPCVLTIPTVMRGQNLSVEATGGSARRLLGFECNGDRMLLELLIKLSK